MGNSVCEEKNDLAKKFDALSTEEREQNIDMLSRHSFLEHKMYSLRDFLFYKHNYINMQFPEDFEDHSSKSKKEFIKSIFKKSPLFRKKAK